MAGQQIVAAVAVAVLLPVPGTAVRADETPRDFVDALTGGQAAVGLRYRHEFVDQDGFGDDANASTLRLRLNYGTAQWRAWSGFAEFDHVVELVRDYNSGAGTSTAVRGRYPVVADPGGPDLNQLYVQFAAAEHWRLRLGRQRILLDDQRFVGGVGWRQNEQTYDGLSLHYTGLPGTTVQYTYVANVERIFGSDVPAGDHEQSTHLLNVRRAVNDDLAVVAYAYLIDNDDAPAFSTNTFGIRAEGGVALGSARLNLLGEYARQSDAANAPADYDADYYRLRALWKSGAITAGIGYEVLGSDNAQGFRTPLATLHAFNGWADKFLATPAGGLEDRYLQLGYELGPWSLQALFHDFEAESSGASYGTELDVSAKRALSKRADLLLKLAAFDSDEPSAFDDTTKAWLMLTTRF